jgi:AraC family transcriptional activator of tynA and feaB
MRRPVRPSPMDDIEPAIHQPTLECEAWLPVSQTREPAAWPQRRSVCGFEMLHLRGDTRLLDQAARELSGAGIEDLHVLLALAGQTSVEQSGRRVLLSPGELTLLNSSSPIQIHPDTTPRGEWFWLRLPPQPLADHVGFEPRPGRKVHARTPGARLLFQLIRATAWGDPAQFHSGERYLQRVAYDLIGALFPESEPAFAAAGTHKLFQQVCKFVRDRFTDPRLGPREVAVEMRVSLRYLQKLFTARGSTCSSFIQTQRLEHAMRLIRRRNLTHHPQPLSQIAYASGFGDYHSFSRAFRQHFGHAPSATCGNSEQDVDNERA